MTKTKDSPSPFKQASIEKCVSNLMFLFDELQEGTYNEANKELVKRDLTECLRLLYDSILYEAYQNTRKLIEEEREQVAISDESDSVMIVDEEEYLAKHPEIEKAFRDTLAQVCPEIDMTLYRFANLQENHEGVLELNYESIDESDDGFTMDYDEASEEVMELLGPDSNSLLV